MMKTMLHATTGRDATELRNGTGSLRGSQRVSFGALLLLGLALAQLLVAQSATGQVLADRQRVEMPSVTTELPATEANPDQGPYLLDRQATKLAVGYPAEAQAVGQEGRVVVRVLVDAKGQVRQWILPRPSGMQALDDAVLAQVPRLRFQPATKNGQPVASWATIPFRFDLR